MTDPAPSRPVAAAPARRLRAELGWVFAGALSAVAVAVTAGTVAFSGVLDARRELVDEIDPALLATERLLAAMVSQETGVRAFVISGDEFFLEPYLVGQRDEEAALAELGAATGSLGVVAPQIAELRTTVDVWTEDYAVPTIDAVRAGDRSGSDVERLQQGRELFDDIRADVAALQGGLDEASASSRDRLDGATTRLVVSLLLGAAAAVGIVSLLLAMTRRRVLAPLEALGADARAVTGGDLEHAVVPVGPAEVQALASAMEAMRARILAELAAVQVAVGELERQAADLERSNAELEQFAYVASHDLQEPLRKVASFCQLLQSRYGGQLDERADQYIEFAVDGAKRMQALINDLLAFSRVGRLTGERRVVGAAELVDRARRNLAAAIEETGASITTDDLPEVDAEAGLAVALFQNLLANAIKFRRPDASPTVHVGVRPAAPSGFHELFVADDGIGIDPEYAERIFVIFQRLHSKEAYAGTGIGLAMCRKIVEHHGGRIWVDTTVATGTTIRFTLPVVGSAVVTDPGPADEPAPTPTTDDRVPASHPEGALP